MKKGILGVVLACLLALSLGVVGCAAPADNSESKTEPKAEKAETKEAEPKEEPKEDPNDALLKGTWALSNVAIDGVELDESLVPEYLEEVGEFTITFKGNGEAEAYFQGATGPCTYTFDGTDGVLIEQGVEMPFTYADGRIGMEQDGATLYFSMK